MATGTKTKHAKAVKYVDNFWKSDMQGKVVQKGSHSVASLRGAIQDLGCKVRVVKHGGHIFLVKDERMP